MLSIINTHLDRQPVSLLVVGSLATLFALFIASMSFWYWTAFAFASNDTAWLMRTGQYILALGHLPSHDIFSWTSSDKPWLLYQWLFEVVLALIFVTAKAQSLWVSGLITAILVGFIYFYLLPKQWLSLKIPSFVVFTLVALTLSPPWFFIRPQLISHLFIPIFINACERYRRIKHLHCIWYLPILIAVWANVHPLWLIGLLIMAAYFLPEALQATSKRLSCALIIACSCLAVLANPYGWNLIKYEWYFNSQMNFKAVNELKPLLLDPSPFFYPFILFLLIAWAMLGLNYKKVPVSGLILSAFGTAASLCMNKFAPIAALLIWPYLGYAIAGIKVNSQKPGLQVQPYISKLLISSRLISRYFQRWRGLRLFLLAVILSVTCFQIRIPTPDYATIVFAYNDIETFRFLFSHHFLGQRIFNDEPTGSLLIYFHILPVFADGRVDFYGKQFCDAWLACIDAEPGWQGYLRKWGVNEIVIRDNTALYQALLDSKQWLKVYDNGLRSIWLPNDSTGRLILNFWKYGNCN